MSQDRDGAEPDGSGVSGGGVTQARRLGSRQEHSAYDRMNPRLASR